jgi:hypothetical protein
MVPITSLLVPILLASVIVFVASSLIHMVLGYHRADFRALPKEADVQGALRGFAIPPGDYLLPCPTGPGGMKAPEFVARRAKGPVLVMTVMPAGEVSMGRNLALWFVYTIIVSLFAAYVAGRALGPGAHYLAVFRFAGATAFAGYSLALMQNSIWFSRNWGMTLRSMFDGLIYALLTAGTFGWLWPR